MLVSLKLKRQKGFTIIELIVVIAIIAILATITMVNVTKYISSSKDAAIKANMRNILVNAESWYATYGSYYKPTQPTNDFFTSAPYTQAIANITTADGISGGFTTIFDPTNFAGFCGIVTLNSGAMWCIDATGYDGSYVSGTCGNAHVSCQ